MPLITVNLTPGIYDRVRSFVEKGLYAGPEQFLEIAVFNQIALEQGEKPGEIVARGHRTMEEPRNRASSSDAGAEAGARRPKGSHLKRTAMRIPGPRRPARAVQETEVDDVMTRISLGSALDGQPAAVRATARPPSERLWGQVNRLFPLKFACRWLAVENVGKNSWDRYDSISERLSADAATFGSVLENLDATAKRKRDELLSTGLPRRGNMASQDRFLSQFVARTTRSAEIYPGAICQYSLAEFDGDRLALTDRGIDLARFKNPILDEDLRRAASTLSDEERSFFTQEILQYVPGELSDIRLVLGAVLGGKTTPDELLTAVRPLLHSEWSAVMVRTHVSGVVARLTEMGLLRRRWEGRNVNYEASGMASTLLTKEQAATHDQTH